MDAFECGLSVACAIDNKASSLLTEDGVGIFDESFCGSRRLLVIFNGDFAAIYWESLFRILDFKSKPTLTKSNAIERE